MAHVTVGLACSKGDTAMTGRAAPSTVAMNTAVAAWVAAR